jgi:hypothetical protein
MADTHRNVALQGSERHAIPGARKVAPADPAERLEVTVLVRRQAPEQFAARIADLCSGKSTPHLSREEFARRHGAAEADLEAVRRFALRTSWRWCRKHAARRTVILAGTVAQFSSAFRVELHQYEHDGGSYRGRTGLVAGARRARERRRGGAGLGQSSTGADAFQVASGSEHFRVIHAASGGRLIRFSERHRRRAVRRT